MSVCRERKEQDSPERASRASRSRTSPCRATGWCSRSRSRSSIDTAAGRKERSGTRAFENGNTRSCASGGNSRASGRCHRKIMSLRCMKTRSRRQLDIQLDDLDPFEVGDIGDDLDPRRAVTDDGNLFALQIDVGVPPRRVPLQSAKVVAAWYFWCDWAVEGARGGNQDVGFDLERFARFDPPESDRVRLRKAVPARADKLDPEDEAVSEAMFRHNPFPVWVGQKALGQLVLGTARQCTSNAEKLQRSRDHRARWSGDRHVHARTSSRPAQCDEKSGFR